MLKIILITCTLIVLSTSIYARGTYQSPADFVSESFAGKPPVAKALWLNDEIKKNLEEILQHRYDGSRIRYWQKDGRTVWVLDETGKTKAITTGIVIEHHKIARIKVLIFRESRGWEVRHHFFTKQYVDVTITDDNKLDRNIDGISGATLSVRALTKQARIALLLNNIVTKQ